MKSIVELINQLRAMDSFAFAQQVGLRDLSAAQGQKIDFDNWLRRSVTPGRRFGNLADAYAQYIDSFG